MQNNTTLPQNTTDTTGGLNTGSSSIDPQALLAGIVKQQLGQSGMVSSSGSTIDNNVANALSAITKTSDARTSQINNDYTDAVHNTTEQGQFDLTSGRSAQSGGLMNIAALNELTGRTDQQLKSLQTAKQQALLNNDAQTASSISSLQLQAYTLQQQANQQVFSNILGLSNLQNSTQQVTNQTKQITDAEKTAINQVALQYGLTVQPGDTLDSITSRAAPLASASQKLELQKTQAQINQANASAYKDLHPTASTSMTDAQVKASAMANLNNVLVPGATLNKASGYAGTPILDTNGKLTPAAFDYLSTNSGMSRQDFVTQVAHLLYTTTDKKGVTTISPNYNLSAGEAQYVTGVKPS